MANVVGIPGGINESLLAVAIDAWMENGSEGGIILGEPTPLHVWLAYEWDHRITVPFLGNLNAAKFELGPVTHRVMVHEFLGHDGYAGHAHINGYPIDIKIHNRGLPVKDKDIRKFAKRVLRNWPNLLGGTNFQHSRWVHTATVIPPVNTRWHTRPGQSMPIECTHLGEAFGDIDWAFFAKPSSKLYSNALHQDIHKFTGTPTHYELEVRYLQEKNREAQSCLSIG